MEEKPVSRRYITKRCGKVMVGVHLTKEEAQVLDELSISMGLHSRAQTLRFLLMETKKDPARDGRME